MANRKTSRERKMSKFLRALHEAGHAVAGYMLNIEVPQIGLTKKDRFQPDEHLFWELLDPQENDERDELERMVMVTSAGWTAAGAMDDDDLDFHTTLLNLLVPEDEDITPLETELRDQLDGLFRGNIVREVPGKLVLYALALELLRQRRKTIEDVKERIDELIATWPTWKEVAQEKVRELEEYYRLPPECEREYHRMIGEIAALVNSDFGAPSPALQAVGEISYGP